MLISILIPTYNRLNFLKEAVGSCLSQINEEIEIIIVQDPTPDGLFEEITIWGKEISNAYSNIKFYCNDTNRGLAGNWNECINFANGKYVIILGDDDRLLPEFISYFSNIVKDFEPDVVFCNQNFIDDKGSVLKDLTMQLNEKYGRSDLPYGFVKDAEKLVWRNSVPMSASLIKKEWILKYPFNPLSNTPEITLFLKIAIKGGSFYFINQFLAEYRVHQISATSGGLRLHYLFSDLEKIQTNEYLLKRNFLNEIGIQAVNICIKSNDFKFAKEIFHSEFYPSKYKIKAIIQYIILYSSPNLRKYLKDFFIRK